MAKHVVFVADDDEDDRYLLEQLFISYYPTYQLVYFSDGDYLLDTLQALPNHEAWPLLILLDLNMPKVSGYEVLRILKSHDQLKEIPVIVLTNSTRAEDIEKCQQLGTNGFLSKPVDFDDLITPLAQWLSKAALPNG